MEALLDIASWGLLIAGSVMLVIGAVGIDLVSVVERLRAEPSVRLAEPLASQ